MCLRAIAYAVAATWLLRQCYRLLIGPNAPPSPLLLLITLYYVATFGGLGGGEAKALLPLRPQWKLRRIDLQ